MIFRLLLLITFIVTPIVQGIEFKANDRVVLLGNTFIERDVNFGHIETALSIGLADKKITFRNLGWSGDTVHGHARSYFGPPKEGFDRLSKHIDFIKPTVVIICYGAVAAFEGEQGVSDFEKGYSKLIDMIRSKAESRIVLMSPPPCENLGPPLPNMDSQNIRLSRYNQVIKNLSFKKECDYVDLFSALGAGKIRMIPPITLNGVHFTSQGYQKISSKIINILGLRELNHISNSEREKLRQIILQKNRLFFNRWRPQNETYLHGFRKHEQGNNAKEIFMFDPLIKDKENQIHSLAISISKEK